jgi:hypothetical protein
VNVNNGLENCVIWDKNWGWTIGWFGWAYSSYIYIYYIYSAMLIDWFPRSALCCIKQFFVGILKWRHPKLDGLYMVETLIIWMIWGYHNFRKPPFVHYIYSELMLSQSINYLCYMMLQLDCCSHARLWAQDPLINHWDIMEYPFDIITIYIYPITTYIIYPVKPVTSKSGYRSWVIRSPASPPGTWDPAKVQDRSGNAAGTTATRPSGSLPGRDGHHASVWFGADEKVRMYCRYGL